MSKRRAGLGRGLDALLESRAPGVESVAIDRLSPNRYQPRAEFDDPGMEELAESIRRQGIVQPIVVTPRADGDYTIVAGERRWRAARRAGLDEVPVVVREVADERQLLEVALVENLQRADLNAVEEAEAFRSLQQTFGMSHEQIARQVGKSRVSITNALRLLALPAEIQDMLRDGRLSAGQARPLLAVDDAKRQLELARRAAREGLTARRLEALAQADGRRRGKPASVDPDTAAAAQRLTRRWQTKVEIHRRGAAGTVRVHFHSEEELMRLYEVISGHEKGKR